MSLKEKKFYPRWPVEIHDGKVVFQDREAFDKHLIPFEGKRKVITLRDEVKERSRQEEKFYHAVVVRMVGEAMDIPDQEAHNFLKDMFLKIEERSTAGYRYTRVLSTTELSDKAYREYWEKCIMWAAQPTLDEGLGPSSGLSLAIPYPNEVDYQDA